jgi:AAA ATPase domain
MFLGNARRHAAAACAAVLGYQEVSENNEGDNNENEANWRREALALLSEGLSERALNGSRPPLAIISGRPGLGKTTLAHRVVDIVQKVAKSRGFSLPGRHHGGTVRSEGFFAVIEIHCHASQSGKEFDVVASFLRGWAFHVMQLPTVAESFTSSRELFQALAREHDAQIAGETGSGLDTALPVLPYLPLLGLLDFGPSDSPSNSPPMSSLSPSEQHSHQARLLGWLLGVVSEGCIENEVFRVLFLLEDVHWMDRDSWDLLAQWFQNSRLQHARCSVLATSRPVALEQSSSHIAAENGAVAGPHHDQNGHSHNLGKRCGFTVRNSAVAWCPSGVFELSPLTPVECLRIAAAIRHVAGINDLPAELAREIIHQAEGCPLVAENMALAHGGCQSDSRNTVDSDCVVPMSDPSAAPAGFSFRAVVRERVLGLEADQRMLLRACACFSRFDQAISVDTLGIVAGSLWDMPSDRVAHAIDAVTTERLLLRTADTLRFAHDAYEKGIYGDLPESTAREVHRQIGVCLFRGLSGGEDEIDLGQMSLEDIEIAAQHLYMSESAHDASLVSRLFLLLGQNGLTRAKWDQVLRFCTMALRARRLIPIHVSTSDRGATPVAEPAETDISQLCHKVVGRGVLLEESPEVAFYLHFCMAISSFNMLRYGDVIQHASAFFRPLGFDINNMESLFITLAKTVFGQRLFGDVLLTKKTFDCATQVCRLLARIDQTPPNSLIMGIVLVAGAQFLGIGTSSQASFNQLLEWYYGSSVVVLLAYASSAPFSSLTPLIFLHF